MDRIRDSKRMKQSTKMCKIKSLKSKNTRKVLVRIIVAVIALAKNNLAFCGDYT